MNIARDLLFLHGYFASTESLPPRSQRATTQQAPAAPEAAPLESPLAANALGEAVAHVCRVPALQWRLSPPRLFDGLPGWAEPVPDLPEADFGPRYGNRVASLDWFGGVRDARTAPAACG
jgi:hypothetical protein